MGLALSLAAVVTGNAQAAADVAVPLKPSGKWVIGAEDGMCTLSRRYGAPARRSVVFTLKPVSLTDPVRAVAIIPKILVVGGPEEGRIQPRALPASTPDLLRSARSEAMPDGGLSVIMTIKRDDLPVVMSASGLVVEANGGAIRLAPTAGRKALEALARCETRLVKAWGLDPAAAIAPYDTSRSRQWEWVSTDDYPQSALARRSEGTTAIIWRVNAAGRVEECRAVKSAGDPDLDAAACKAITRRGRYSPRLDKVGNPIPFWTARLVTWRLPKP